MVEAHLRVRVRLLRDQGDHPHPADAVLMRDFQYLLRVLLLSISVGEIALPLVAETPQKHRFPLPPPIPVTRVAEGPRLTPTPILVPDIFIRTENVKVSDGDTIRCDVCFPWGVTLKAETIRAGDYDAWESSKMRRTVHVTDEEVARGKAAAEDLRELLKSGTLYLSPLPNEDRDAYGRLLATFLLVDTRTQQCIFIKEYMSAHGHCRK